MGENFDKTAIMESFLDEVNAYLPEIEANLDRLQQTPDDLRALQETYRRTHTISGSASMMEFQALAHVAQGMEEILDEALERQEALSAPTIALLRRSCGRLRRIVENIREEQDDSAIIAEDDQDRAAWRGSGATSSGSGGLAAPGADASSAAGPEPPDWLAAFAGPASANGSSPANAAPASADAAHTASSPGAEATSPSAQRTDPWGVSVSNLPTGAAPAISPPGAQTSQPPAAPHTPQAGAAVPSTPGAEPYPDPWGRSQASAFDPFAPPSAGQPAETPTTPHLRADISEVRTSPSLGGPSSSPSAALPPPPAAPQAGMLVSVDAAGALATFDELRADEEAVRRQAATLRTIVAMMREAAQAMEDERAELGSFLDGSSDALDRLEDWVGQQMGLDLRRSPEGVRNYLPLSVIWVTTTRLKKLIALLNSSSRNLTVTQEQIDEALSEFHAALDSFGSLYSALASVGPAPDGGFSATVAQITWAPGQTGQARSPQPTQPTLPVPAPQPSGEGAEQTLSVGARADLERAVREELRRSLEDEVREELSTELRREEEQRLRGELEIQVRRQMLAELAPGLGESSVTVRDGSVHVQTSGPFIAVRPPKQVQVTDEQSPEALEVFRDEAQEHLQTITDGIKQLEQYPGDMSAVQAIRRAMHTLKGAAGMMGFTLIQRLAHTSEDLLDQLTDGAFAITPAMVGLTLDTAEALDQLVSGAIPDPADQQRLVQALIVRYAAITGATDVPDLTADEPGNEAIAIALGEEEEASAAPAASDGSDLSVRLQLSKLDELVSIFSELVQRRTIAEERITRLAQKITEAMGISARVRDLGVQIEERFETVMLPSRASAGMITGPNANAVNAPRGAPGARNANGANVGFDNIELDRYDEFHYLSRGLTEGVGDLISLSREMERLVGELQFSSTVENRLSSDFQDRLLRARLVPVRSLAPRLYRAARTSAQKEGKEIEFFIEGGDTEVDRKVVEAMEGPLLHLVRNAVNHGIERPADRQAVGKPRAGKIVVSAAYEGNQVVISVSDDGAGIDPERIRTTAAARGQIDPEARITEREAVNLIFQPGVSTAATITEESGRGVGLDVVRDAVARLRGTVEVDPTIGHGATFTMKFPISLQIARAVLVRVGSQTLAIPMAVVEHIGRLDYYQRVNGPAPAVEVRGERYPLARLSDYLQLPPTPVEERSPVLLINVGRHRLAMLVDAIVNQQEVVSKPLGAHLRDVPGVAGATVLGNGQVVLILEMLDLLAQQPFKPVALPAPGARAQPTSATQPVSPNQWAAAFGGQPSAGSTPRQQLPQPPIPPGMPAPNTRPAQPQSYAPAAPGGQMGQIRPASRPNMSNQRPAAQPISPWQGQRIPEQTPFERPQVPSTPIGSMPGGSLGQMPMANLPPFMQRPPQRPQGVSPMGQSPTSGGQGGQMNQQARQRLGPPPGARNAYVLVVDDSPSVRRVVSNMLKSYGWEVQTARDGIEALEVMSRQQPAAVLLDIEMPRMDGYELIATVRSQEHDRHLPLIVLTSRAAAKHRQRADQLGASAYLVKPYQDEELLKLLNDLISANMG